MRLDPDEEFDLKVRLRLMRLSCNWMWPLIVVASALLDVVSIIGGEQREWHQWLVSIVFYSAGVWLWADDVRRLRELRMKWAEAQSSEA